MAQAGARPTVALFVTCLAESYYPRSLIAIVKVLEHLGYRVEFPEAQTCCGQPMHNNGLAADAARLARRMLEIFAPYEYVVTPSSSCAAMVCEHYREALEADAADVAAAANLARRTYEFGDFLTRVHRASLSELGVKWPGAVTYHYSCHARGHATTKTVPALLAEIPELEYTALENLEQCCGFGGAFMVKYPGISNELVHDKVAAIRATGACTVVSNDAGCTMNIAGACHRAGLAVEFKSLAEIIAEGLGLLDREERA
ncbi:MAG: (Fe-S)-binding protein [Planctomycetota bacterium]